MEDFRIKVFKAVYASGSFTKAAGMLGISQPAVSQNISELEKELGIQLFTRSGGKVETTRQGEIFMRYADRISSAYDSVSAAFMTPLPEGAVFRIYPDPAVRYYLMDEISSALASIFPGRDFNVTDTAEGADICIVSTPSRQSGSLVFRFSVLPSDHPLSSIVSSLLENLLV